MKDDYKRRRVAERQLIKTLPNVDPNDMSRPMRQELIDVNSNQVMDVSAQDNEFIVTIRNEWWIETYVIDEKSRDSMVSTDSLSEVSDDELVPQSHIGKSLWCAMPREIGCGKYGALTFVSTDIIGCIIPDSPASVCTFYVRTGELLAKVTVPGEHYLMCASKISDSKFVVGSDNGNLYFFSHDRGRNLKETSRIWKAHMLAIWELSCHKDIVVSVSADWTARLWDAESKERLAVLYHDQAVEDVAITDDYIVTCSRYSRVPFKKGEMRIYKNSGGYELLKILRHTHFMGIVKLVDNKRVVCQHFGLRNDDNEKIERDLIMVIDIDRECVVAQLKIRCRIIHDYTILADGRLLAVGTGGCRGVIATFPHRVRELICDKDTKRVLNRRIPCSLV